MTFEAWLKAVDDVIVQAIGLYRDDISDWDYWSAWDDGMDPDEAAESAMLDGGVNLAD